MTDATKKFLKDTFGFTDEEITANDALFSAREDKFSAVATAHADIATARAAVDEMNAKLTREMAEWAEASAVGDTRAADLKAKLDATELRAFQLQQKLTGLAVEHNIDPKTVLPGDGTLVEDPAKKVTPSPNLEGMVTAQQLGAVANAMLNLMPELQSIAREHFELTGEHIDTKPLVAELQARAGTKGNTKPVDVRLIWEEKHDVATKRTAASDAALAKRLDAAREEGYQRARTEQAVPGQHSPGTSAQVFRTPSALGQSKLPRPAAPNRIAAAASALANHKYAGGKKPAAA